LIGDPSGKKTTRPHLSVDEVAQHAETYTEQAFKILDKNRTTIRFNSNWLRVLNFADIIKLAAKFTVARILERDDFSERYQKNQPILLHEFLYPVMQAYDSVVIKSDIELGGTDQKFNMLAGRDLQEKNDQEAQVVISVPILEGVDGVQKMSKSLGNHIGLTDSASEMFGKVMSIPDTLMISYFKLATNLSGEKVNEIEEGLKSGKLHPGETKRMLAKEIITLYHSKKEAEEAEAEFDRVFKEREMPTDIPVIKIGEDRLEDSNKIWIVKLLTETGLTSSNGEARRFIQGNAVKLNGKLIDNVNAEIEVKEDDILQVGKRKFVKIQF
jgi:tyrosyl-tRNA synthetase